MYYAGIGSRKTPQDILKIMERIGEACTGEGYILRSGGAPGADMAFEKGCTGKKRSMESTCTGKKEIWNPWKNKITIHDWAVQKATEVCWEYPLARMKPFVQALIVRNMYQIFGESGVQPVDFVVYWCPGNPLEKGFESGGTRYAVRAADTAGIRTFNLRTQKDAFIKWWNQ